MFRHARIIPDPSPVSSHFLVMRACSSRWMAARSSFCSVSPAGVARYRYFKAVRIVRGETSIIVVVILVFFFVLVGVFVFVDERVVVGPVCLNVGFDEGQ